MTLAVSKETENVIEKLMAALTNAGVDLGERPSLTELVMATTSVVRQISERKLRKQESTVSAVRAYGQGEFNRDRRIDRLEACGAKETGTLRVLAARAPANADKLIVQLEGIYLSRGATIEAEDTGSEASAPKSDSWVRQHGDGVSVLVSSDKDLQPNVPRPPAAPGSGAPGRRAAIEAAIREGCNPASERHRVDVSLAGWTRQVLREQGFDEKLSAEELSLCESRELKH